MNLKQPMAIHLRGGDRAVLLLHSFTGTANEMKRLATHLHQQQFTCFAPIYKGHGAPPTTFYEYGVEDWLQSAKEGYLFLQRQGYKHIAIVGQSLGGVFALRLAQIFSPAAIVTMSSPIVERELTSLASRVEAYTRYYLKLNAFAEPEIFIDAYFPRPVKKLHALQQCITQTAPILSDITTPALILAGEADATVYQQSAKMIYDQLASTRKIHKTYADAKHLLTLERQSTPIFSNITQFLNNEMQKKRVI